MSDLYLIDKHGIVAKSSLKLTKSDHNKNMPPRTDSYLESDERGHLIASSLGGSNDAINIVPQSKYLNHGSYLAVEKGETSALLNGATIDSEKMAYKEKPGAGRPDTFYINDKVEYADGHSEELHFSFPNLTQEEMESLDKEEAACLDNMEDFPNPGDTLREIMSPEEYNELMEATDAEMASIEEEYNPSETVAGIRADLVQTADLNNSGLNKENNEGGEEMGGQGRGGP